MLLEAVSGTCDLVLVWLADCPFVHLLFECIERCYKRLGECRMRERGFNDLREVVIVERMIGSVDEDVGKCSVGRTVGLGVVSFTV